MNNTAYIDTCPYCGSKALIPDTKHGEVYCNACMSIIEDDLLDNNILNPGKIVRDEHSFNNNLGSTFIPTTRKEARMLFTHHNVLIGNNRRLYTALTENKVRCSILGVPPIMCQSSALIIKRIFKHRIAHDVPTIETMVAASMYIASRQHKYHYTIRGIIDNDSYAKHKYVFRFVWKVLKELNIFLPPKSKKQKINKQMTHANL